MPVVAPGDTEMTALHCFPGFGSCRPPARGGLSASGPVFGETLAQGVHDVHDLFAGALGFRHRQRLALPLRVDEKRRRRSLPAEGSIRFQLLKYVFSPPQGRLHVFANIFATDDILKFRLVDQLRRLFSRAA